MPYTNRYHVFKSGNTSNISVLHHSTSYGHIFFYLNYSGDFFHIRLRYEICQQNYNYVSLKISTEVFPFLFNLQGFHPSSLAGRLDEWRANRRTQSSRMKKLLFFKYITNLPACLILWDSHLIPCRTTLFVKKYLLKPRPEDKKEESWGPSCQEQHEPAMLH